jgi:fluoroacetyl-CoA thioesterase
MKSQKKKAKSRPAGRMKKAPAKKAAKPASAAHATATPPLPDGPRIGLEGIAERVVELQHTIQAVSPNLPPVLSTPMMIGLMEHATVKAITADLPPGAISVGTRIEVDHLKAVGPGATVVAWAKLIEYRGRFLVFDVEARSGEHVIGRGRVFRAIVQPREHGEKAAARVQQ